MSRPSETIVAVATPSGRGGIGVVRISGEGAQAIARALCGVEPPPREARLVAFRDQAGATIDRGLALFFPAPHSFTGEAVLELHAHGSPVVLDALVRRACELGARPARAGEFSERAFLNGKLDLVQAEAIADLIASRSGAQARAALRSLAGEFSRQVESVGAALLALRVEVEAAIDFAEDASEAASTARLENGFAVALARLEALLGATRRGVRLTDGMHAVIAGAPNVGKSSLLNALAGDARAIVTAIPGTTRDVLRESIMLDGVELTLVDTAGLRESDDVVEGEGIRRARAELERADVVLWVVEQADASDRRQDIPGLPATAACIRIVNKIDLTGAQANCTEMDGMTTLALSARTGAGIDLLREALHRLALGGGDGGDFSARSRHVVALDRACQHLRAARAALAQATPELMAEDLREAQQALGEVTGTFTSDDLLGAIFSTFCIGK